MIIILLNIVSVHTKYGNMRDRIIINSTIKKYGSSFCIPIQKSERDILGVTIGDDLEIEVRVMERKTIPKHLGSKSIEELKTIVGPIAERNKIEHVSLFGSRSRGDFREDSDYDFLIRTGPDASLIDMGVFASDLEDVLGTPVDLANEESVSDLFLSSIKEDLREIYG